MKPTRFQWAFTAAPLHAVHICLDFTDLFRLRGKGLLLRRYANLPVSSAAQRAPMQTKALRCDALPDSIGPAVLCLRLSPKHFVLFFTRALGVAAENARYPLSHSALCTFAPLWL